MKGITKIENLQKKLFFLLIFLIPVQLGRHFFFNFSQIAGIPSDYLTPTIYLTDIIIFLMAFLEAIMIFFFQSKKRRFENTKGSYLFFGYLIFSTVFIAVNKWASFYKLIKIAEFFILFKIIRKLRPETRKVLFFYCLSVLYTSYLAIKQFLAGESLGGWWWYLGERTFHASSPGIALSKISGRLFLRPYATFAHPNVLGGFLAAGLPLVLYYLLNEGKDKRVIKLLSLSGFIWGAIVLFLTYSRAAWFMFFTGIAIIFVVNFNKRITKYFSNKKLYLPILLFLFLLSIYFPIKLSEYKNSSEGSLFERSELIYASLLTFVEKPIFGTGLNNSFLEQYKILPKSYGLFILQPVHNSYMLLLTELGLTGFAFILLILRKILALVNRNNIISFLPLILILMLGFFDHYPVSLQQGLLILTVFAGMAFSQSNKLNEETS